MAVDTSADSALLVQAKYEEFKAAASQLSDHNQAVQQWYQKPWYKVLFNRGYPKLDDEVMRRLDKTGVVDALRQHPATYPLGFIWSHGEWTDKRFWYGFEYYIDGNQFVVQYPRMTITTQLSDKDKPLIEVRGEQQDPVLHLPKGFRVPVYNTAYDDSSCSRSIIGSKYAYWAPQLTDAPSTITIPDGAFRSYKWAKTRREAPTYKRTQVVPAA